MADTELAGQEPPSKRRRGAPKPRANSRAGPAKTVKTAKALPKPKTKKRAVKSVAKKARADKTRAKNLRAKKARAAQAQPVAAAPQRPKVSVVIPTYNRAQYLPDAVDCILAQSFRNWELFIVDDGSTDGTREAVQPYVEKDKRIHYVRQAHRGGPAAGLNRVLPELRGDYLYKHDDDDIASPEKIAKCAAFLDAHPDCFAVKVRFRDMRFQADDSEGKANTQFFSGIPLFYRVAVLRAIGGWNEFYPIIEDSDMLMRAAEQGWREGELDEVLYTYRRVSEDRRQVSNAFNLLGYRLILYRSQLLRAWGLPDLTQHGWDFRRILRFCYTSRRAYLPKARQAAWQKSLRLDVPMDPDNNEIWSAQFAPMRHLTYQSPRFPWRALWAAWAYAARLMQLAHMPRRMRLTVFAYIARVYYFHPRRKQEAQDRFAFRRRNDVLTMARSKTQLRLPVVSVGLVTWRADAQQAARVRRAIASIRAQTSKNWELLVLDNRSTAETRRFLRACAKDEPRLRLIEAVRPQRFADGLNSLRVHARGQFFCRQDEAGISHPQRLEKSAAYLKRHTNYYALSTEMQLMQDKKTRPYLRRPPLFLRMGAVDYLHGWRALGDAFRAPHAFPLAEDCDMGERLAQCGFSCGHLARPLYALEQGRAGSRLQSTPASAAYHLLLQQGASLRRYGIKDFYEQAQSVRRMLAAIYGRCRLLPRLIQIEMGGWAAREHAAWRRLAHIRYRLRKERARFPYRALWVALARTHRIVRTARLPWRQRSAIFWHLARAFLRSLRAKARA